MSSSTVHHNLKDVTFTDNKWNESTISLFVVRGCALFVSGHTEVDDLYVSPSTIHYSLDEVTLMHNEQVNEKNVWLLFVFKERVVFAIKGESRRLSNRSWNFFYASNSVSVWQQRLAVFINFYSLKLSPLMLKLQENKNFAVPFHMHNSAHFLLVTERTERAYRREIWLMFVFAFKDSSLLTITSHSAGQFLSLFI